MTRVTLKDVRDGGMGNVWRLEYHQEISESLKSHFKCASGGGSSNQSQWKEPPNSLQLDGGQLYS